MPDSEKKKAWAKANFWMLCLKLHRKHDADIVAYLEEKGEDKQKAIKAAVRAYMAKEDV